MPPAVRDGHRTGLLVNRSGAYWCGARRGRQTAGGTSSGSRALDGPGPARLTRAPGRCALERPDGEPDRARPRRAIGTRRGLDRAPSRCDLSRSRSPRAHRTKGPTSRRGPSSAKGTLREHQVRLMVRGRPPIPSNHGASVDTEGHPLSLVMKGSGVRVPASASVSVQSLGFGAGALCEEGRGVAAGGGGEEVGEILVEAAALEAAGGVGREQPSDPLLAVLALAAERQLAIDHCAA